MSKVAVVTSSLSFKLNLSGHDVFHVMTDPTEEDFYYNFEDFDYLVFYFNAFTRDPPEIQALVLESIKNPEKVIFYEDQSDPFSYLDYYKRKIIPYYPVIYAPDIESVEFVINKDLKISRKNKLVNS